MAHAAIRTEQQDDGVMFLRSGGSERVDLTADLLL